MEQVRTSQEKKSILKSYGEIEGRVSELRDELEMLWDANALASPTSNEPVRGGGEDGNKTERTYELIEKLSELLESEIDELLLLEYRITQAIQQVPNIVERRVLTLAYIGKPATAKNGRALTHKRLSLFNIARELSYSYDRVKHIHGAALFHIKL